MISINKPSLNYRKFLKGANTSIKRELYIPIRDKDDPTVVVGKRLVKVDVIELLKSIPDYNPFRNAEDYYVDTDEMDRFAAFVTNECIYPEGDNAGLPFIPELWQWAIFFNMFCWKKKKNNKRRYREVFIYVPRKNGKTSAFGVICTLYMFFVDKEKRSQNYCCAADVDQASINFRHVVYNIEQNPNLLSRLVNKRVNRSNKTFEHVDGSVFKVLSSISETKHGLSPNFVYVDEVHAHADGELIDVMVTGTASRSQPMIVYTTTADFDRLSICNDLHNRAKSVALGYRDEPGFLPVIYEATTEDDFKSEEVWRKANPNYGISIQPDYFQRSIAVCMDNPSLLNRFLRLHLNIKTKTETAWIPSWVWANGNSTQSVLLSVDEIKENINEFHNWHNITKTPDWNDNTLVDMYLEEYRSYYTWYFKKLRELRYSECYGGYDNTSSNDVASFSLYFPNESAALWWYWVPAESIYKRSHVDKVPYDRWFKAGIINNTPLACIDEEDIGSTLVGNDNGIGICSYFEGIRIVGYDQWGANYIYSTLTRYGINAKKYPQGFAAMNEPCRKLETMITNKEFFHGNNPVSAWMMNNAMVQQNNSNQKRVDKNCSTDKVDGIVALLNGIGASIYGESNVISNIHGLE